jgi:hypothetical protein
MKAATVTAKRRFYRLVGKFIGKGLLRVKREEEQLRLGIGL